MTVYIIHVETVTARAFAPAKGSQGEVVVGSAAEIAGSALSLGQMVAVWNALPGTTAISKFKDRKTPPRNACGPLSHNCRSLRRAPIPE